MMRLKNNLSCAPLRLFLLVCLLVVSHGVMADSGAWYFNDAKYFYWSNSGDCEIEFSIPMFIWDSSSNDAVTWGYIYVTPEGESETSILYYAYDKSRDQDKPVTFQASAEGEFKIVNTTKPVTMEEGKQQYVVDFPMDEWVDTTRLANYPLKLLTVMFSTGKPTKNQEYTFDVPGMELVYKHMPADEQPQLVGDVNGDGEISIADVTALVDLVIRQDNNARSDVNVDGETSVADVTALIGLLMTL